MRQKKNPVVLFAVIGMSILALIALMIIEMPVKTQTVEQNINVNIK